MINAIVLAAGTSSRYGSENKLLLPFGESVVVRETIKRVQAAGIACPVVVTGHQFEKVEAALAGLAVTFVHNPDFLSGEMLSSIHTGLRHLLSESAEPACAAQTCAALIALGDQPLLPVPIMQRLIEAFRRNCAEIIAPRYEAQRGHPVLLARRWWPEALALQPGHNLRDLLKAHPEAVAFLQVNTDAVLRDVDTPEAYAEALAIAQANLQAGR